MIDNSGIALLRHLVRLADTDVDDFWAALPDKFSGQWFSDYDQKTSTWTPSALTHLYEMAALYYDNYGECPSYLHLEDAITQSRLEPAERDRVLSTLTALGEVTPTSGTFQAAVSKVFDNYQKGRIVESAFTLLRSATPGHVKTAIQYTSDQLAEISRMSVAPEKSRLMGETRSLSEMVAEYTNSLCTGQGVVQYQPFPFPSWNNAIMGMAAGELGVLVAAYNAGKTAILKAMTLHVAANVDPNEYIVVMADLEMSQAQLYQRLEAHVAGLPWKLVASVQDPDSVLTDAEWDTYVYAMEALASRTKHVLAVAPADCATPASLRREIERFRDGRKVALVTVDYLTRMKPNSNSRAARWDQVEEIIHSLKDIAFDLECPVWTAVHSNREGETQFAVVDRHADTCIHLTPDPLNPPRHPDTNHPDPRSRYYGTMGTVVAEVTRNRGNAKGYMFNLSVEFSTMTIQDGGVRTEPVLDPSRKKKWQS